jgi:NAD(P)-dependent dehydrogenase (short-subunit alcohol dehydrogenase family)
MSSKLALVTHVTHYAGPGAARALADGYRVVCHDGSFVDSSARQAFSETNPGYVALAEQDPTRLVDAALQHGDVLSTIVSNDYVARPRDELTVAETDEDEFRQMLETLTVFPYSLLRSAIAVMRASGGGSVIFITSSGAKRPIAHKPIYSVARAATTALVEAAAKRLSRENILLYAIGPTFFENETYFSRAEWENDAALRDRVDREMPLGRLGTQDELGALIAFLASGCAAPTVGQFFAFTGAYLP